MRANEFGARHRGAAGARKGLRIRSDDDPTPPVDAIGGGCDYAGAQVGFDCPTMAARSTILNRDG
jgi:hypothetical protein